MLRNLLISLTYLAASVLALLTIVLLAPTTAAAVALCTLLVALLPVLATLTRDPDDLVRVVAAVTDLVRGRNPP